MKYRFAMKTRHRVILGDSRSMGELEDGSVHLVVTSPPYWQLKDYGTGGQIGFNDSYEDYINNLGLVWNECRRVLHGGCRLCINVGDQFARAAYYGRYKVIPIRAEVIKFCESAGLDYMGSVVWRKVTTCNTTGGATVMGSFPYPRNGILKIDYESILLFKKPGEPPRVPEDVKRRAALTTAEWNEYFSGHWSFPGEKQRGHLAMFPEELPRRLIRMFTFEGETVLDPFLGSGTTSLAAMRLGRNSAGYEINEEYLSIIRSKLGEALQGVQTMLDAESTGPARSALTVERRPALQFDVEQEIAKLPYIFRDPLRLDKKRDPRKLGFGSRIDGRRTEKRELIAVRSVLSPVLLELADGRRVRLLGIKPIPGKEREAAGFLREATRGQKVYVVEDVAGRAHDVGAEAEQAQGGGGGAGRAQDGCLRVYAYLKNRTFLNAHLIKRGLAEADDSSEHRLKERFRGYQKKY
jgi:site-specific DNA-methyltransferase (adenine-specific)